MKSSWGNKFVTRITRISANYTNSLAMHVMLRKPEKKGPMKNLATNQGERSDQRKICSRRAAPSYFSPRSEPSYLSKFFISLDFFGSFCIKAKRTRNRGITNKFSTD